MYPILVSGDSILGAKVSGFDFWRFILGAKVSVFDIWGFPSGTAFHLGFWKEYEKHGDASAWSEEDRCIDMHGFLGT